MNLDPIESAEPESDLCAWLRARLARPAAASVWEAGAGTRELTPAAVLVPLVLREGEPTVLLTRRTEHLADHPGQISFPGGRCEPQDASRTDTALRETHEEIGLVAEHIEVVGVLPEYFTGTGFQVTPVVGLVRPPFALALDAFEVAEVFEVPLSFLMDAANHQRHQREVRGQLREYWAMPWGEYFIWGATAGMLKSLHAALHE